MNDLSKLLTDLNACDEAKQWAAPYATLHEVWNACERSDWMLWLIVKLDVELSEQEWRLLTCDFAEQAIPYCGDDDYTRSICEATIETARRYALGDATEEEISAARSAAWSAAYSAASSAARSAAGSAASSAARSAVGSAAGSAAGSVQAKIIRENVTWEKVEKAAKKYAA